MLLVPRLDGKYAKAGTLGEIEQIGRLPGGAQAAVIRGVARVLIGAGTTGPGAALWVGATVLDEITDAQVDRARPRLQGAGHDGAGAPRRLAGDRLGEAGRTSPAELSDLAGYASYLSNEQKS